MKQDITYPCTMASIDEFDSLIVLFNAPGKGTVISTNNLNPLYCNAAGNYSEGWVMKYFKLIENK